MGAPKIYTCLSISLGPITKLEEKNPAPPSLPPTHKKNKKGGPFTG